MKYAVAIDIGGTNTRVALIDEKLNIVSREQFPTDNKEPELTLNKISDIVKAFEKANSIEIPYVIKPRRAGDIAECFADATKAKKILGWIAEKNLEDMCRDSWNWQSHNVNGYK